MGLFSKRIGTVFLKEESDAAVFIEKMQGLLEKADGELAKKIEKQINIAKYGEIGENNIAFELKHSGIDMYVLHDIYLEADGLAAQIDYLVITRQHIYVIECKNLIGNIEIDNTGAFVRSYEFSRKKYREGIYSPVTQNQRHLQVLKENRMNSKGNFLSKMIFEKNFADSYQSIVVLANPKTCLSARYAPKRIKEQVIRADQLIEYIKKKDALCKDRSLSDADMLELANFYLKQNKPERSDYAQKYEEMIRELNPGSLAGNDTPVTEADAPKVNDKAEVDAQKIGTEKVEKEEVIKKLKEFRLNRSRKENIKPYYIFNDAQMADLLEKMPQNKEELIRVAGFGSVKAEKYGDEVLEILWK